MGQGHDHDGIFARRTAADDAAAYREQYEAERAARVAAERRLDALRQTLARMSEASDVVAVDPAHPRGTLYVMENGARQLQTWDDAEGERFELLAPVPSTRAALATNPETGR